MSAQTLVTQLDQLRRKVAFDTFDIIVQQLTTMVEEGAIDVAPVYQRQFRWDNIKRSQLIESIFLGVPVPSLFMATNKDGTWELVDGVQRLSTVVQYAGSPQARARLDLSSPLVLEGLDKLTAYNGLGFIDLPESIKLQFRHRPLKVITLSDKSDMQVRFDLFERLNTGGVALTNQEIRACIYRGDFANFLERTSKDKAFKMVLRLTTKQERDGTREECVLRFFAFLHHYGKFEHSVVDFLNDFMEEATADFDTVEGGEIFEATFKKLARALPHGIVRAETRNITPINLFEAVAVGAALALKQRTDLVTSGVQTWINSAELRDLTTGATNSRKMVKGRIEFCRDKFLGR